MKHNPDVITLADKSAEQNEQINWQAYNPASMATAFKNLPLKGNIIPLAWFIHIKFANGKPDVNAILILADIVYWYRPVVIRDQDTGDIIGHRHKFKSSLLQKSYQHYAELFGFSKRQVREAMYRLEKQGLIQRVLRTVPTPCTVLQNVLFIALNLPKLTAVTLRTGEIIKTDANNESVQIIDQNDLLSASDALHLDEAVGTLESDTTNNRVGNLLRYNVIPLPLEQGTYTETTTQIIKETTTHSHAHVNYANDMVDIWNEVICSAKVVQLTSKRVVQLNCILQKHFQSNIQAWRWFCQQISQSPFLMGQGERGWHVTLDWVLKPHNLQKIFEGNYNHSSTKFANQIATSLSPIIDYSVEEILSAIDDSCLQKFICALLEFIPSAQYQRWFSSLEHGVIDRYRLTLHFSDRWSCRYVQKHFYSELRVAAKNTYPAILEVECVIKDDQSVTVVESAEHSHQATDNSLPDLLHARLDSS